jgi:hypothetical protein
MPEGANTLRVMIKAINSDVFAFSDEIMQSRPDQEA